MQDEFSATVHELATACTMRVPVFGMYFGVGNHWVLKPQIGNGSLRIHARGGLLY